MASEKRVKKIGKRKKQSREKKKQQRHFKPLEYIITYEALEDKQLQQLPSQIAKRIAELHSMIKVRPRQAITELLELIESYPNIPKLYNYLTVAYAEIRDIENEEATILACYEKFPNYLFGRLNYAELCLRRKEMEKIPEIFEGKLSLKLLYPQRTEFHVSEFASFTGFFALYFLLVGDLETSKSLYDTLIQVAPEHPTVEKIEYAVSSLAR